MKHRTDKHRRTTQDRTNKNNKYDRLKKNHKKSKKRRQKVDVLKSTTPKNIQYVSSMISDEINSIGNFENKKGKARGLFKYSSYSPTINKELVSLKSLARENIIGCNNDRAFELHEPLQIEIPGNKCVPYYDERAKKLLLRNLSANKHIDVSKIITPKQYLANCWFNTMFVIFFISDKGRKFFHYFRQLMIVGELKNGKKIPQKLADAFALLNFAIESSLTGSKYAYDLDTNSIIQQIYDFMPKNLKKSTTKSTSDLDIVSYEIYNINEAGNPFDYYLSIIQYLDETKYIDEKPIDFLLIETLTNPDWKNSVREKIKNNNYYPHTILIVIPDFLNNINSYGTSNIIKDKQEEFSINDSRYVLDSCVIRDNYQQHFCALITCEGKQYAYDGESYHRLVQFEWKQHINSSYIWSFHYDDENYYELKPEWSFLKGYQILMYYLT